MFSTNCYEIIIQIVCISVNIVFIRVELLKKPNHIHLTYHSRIVCQEGIVSYEHIDLTPNKCHIDHGYHKPFRFVLDSSQKQTSSRALLNVFKG